jgi:hypothetical protein
MRLFIGRRHWRARWEGSPLPTLRRTGSQKPLPTVAADCKGRGSPHHVQFRMGLASPIPATLYAQNFCWFWSMLFFLSLLESVAILILHLKEMIVSLS